ncbi:MAG: 2Fe-2S iron-sulfur cluster-binding protein [Paracoccaceae bacterium]
MHSIQLDKTDTIFDCAPGDTILRAALRSGIGMSYSCNVGSCGNCRFELVEGEVTHARQDPPAWSQKDKDRKRWLGCQAVPERDCVVKFRADPSAVPRFRPAVREAILLRKTALNHDITEFAFQVGGDPAFLPGQYALLQLPGCDGARVYSMSNLGEDGEWQFQIRRVPGGAATTVLFDRLEPGENIMLDGPYGLAYLRPDAPRDIVLIAGGSGLSPMASLARGALRDTDRNISIYFGGRGPADTTAAAFLASLDPARVSLTMAISDSGQAQGWTGRQGFIHEIAIADLGEALRDREIYFAGPAAMAQAIAGAMHALSVPRDQIHYDEFY